MPYRAQLTDNQYAIKKNLLLFGLFSYMASVNTQATESIEAGPKLGLNIPSWG